MFWSVLAAEQGKLFRRIILWIEILILTGVVLLLSLATLFLIPAQTGAADQPVTWAGSLVNMLGLIASPQLAGLLLIILVGAVVAQEYTWRTLHHLLGHGIPRKTLLGAKFVAILLPLLLLVLIPLTVGGIGTALFIPLANGVVNLGAIDYLQLVLAVVYTPYTLLPYGALAFLLAIAGRSTVTAIAGGTGMVLGESVLVQLLSAIGDAGIRIAQWFPAMLATSVASLSEQIADEAVLGNAQAALPILEPGLAAVVIAVYTVVLLALTNVVFARQDLTG